MPVREAVNSKSETMAVDHVNVVCSALPGVYYSRRRVPSPKVDIIMRGCLYCDQHMAKFTLPKISSQHDINSFDLTFAEVGLPFGHKVRMMIEIFEGPRCWTRAHDARACYRGRSFGIIAVLYEMMQTSARTKISVSQTMSPTPDTSRRTRKALVDRRGACLPPTRQLWVY